MRMYAEAANDTMQSNADAPPAAKAAMRAALGKSPVRDPVGAQ